MIAIKPISGIKPTFSQYFKNVESTVVNKSKVSSGELKIDYVCDHYLISEWEAIKEGLKKNANSEKRFKVRTSSLLGSPGQNNMRTYFTVIWHVQTVLDDSREQRFTLSRSKMSQNYPFLKDANFRLTTLIYVNSAKTKKHKPNRLSGEQQAKKYRQLLNSGKVKNKAAIARKFGVSRAWVTKVLQ